MFRLLNYLILLVLLVVFAYLIFRTITISESLHYYFKYLVLFSLAIISILYFIIYKKKFEKELPLFFFTTLICVYSLEYFSYLFLKKSNNPYYKEDLFNYFEIEKKKNKNLTIFHRSIIIDENETTIAPLSGISNIETILCNENGYFATYLSDRYGFRNNDKIWDEGFDWVLLGDSFVHGSCVKDEETIKFFLKKKIKENILNLAIVGNNGYNQIGTYKEYLKKNYSKNIIWFYYEGNDFRLLADNEYGKITKKYLKNNFSQNLQKKQTLLNKGLKEIFDIKLNKYKEKKKFTFLKLVNLRLLMNQAIPNLGLVKKNKHKIYKTQPTSEELTQLKKIIDTIKHLTKKNNQNLYFVYLPSFQRYHNKQRSMDEMYYNKEEIINYLSKDNYLVVDIHKELFSKMRNPLELFPYKNRKGHYTPEGYKLVSEIINNKIFKDQKN